MAPMRPCVPGGCKLPLDTGPEIPCRTEGHCQVLCDIGFPGHPPTGLSYCQTAAHQHPRSGRTVSRGG